MKRALQSIENTDCTGRNLHAKIHTLIIESLCFLENAPPLVGREIPLHQGQRTWSFGRARKCLQYCEFFIKLIAFTLQVEIVYSLQDTCLTTFQR